MNETTMNLLELLQHPPTILIYRPDGRFSLDQFPDMETPDAVVCFRSMEEARTFLDTSPALKGFRPVELSLGRWLEAIREEAANGRTHLAIFHLPGDGSFGKCGFRITDVVAALEDAGKAIEEESRSEERWRWN